MEAEDDEPEADGEEEEDDSQVGHYPCPQVHVHSTAPLCAPSLVSLESPPLSHQARREALLAINFLHTHTRHRARAPLHRRTHGTAKDINGSATSLQGGACGPEGPWPVTMTSDLSSCSTHDV